MSANAGQRTASSSADGGLTQADNNDNGTIAFRRWVGSDAHDAVVALNNSFSPKPVHVPVGSFATDGTSYTDALSGAHYTVHGGALDLPAVDGNYGAVLLRDVPGK